MSDHISYSEDSMLGQYARALKESRESPDDAPLARPEIKLVHSVETPSLRVDGSEKPRRRRKRSLRILNGGKS